MEFGPMTYPSDWDISSVEVPFDDKISLQLAAGIVQQYGYFKQLVQVYSSMSFLLLYIHFYVNIIYISTLSMIH